MPHSDAGTRIDPLVSEPSAIGTSPAATAAAEPPDEPPAIRVRSCGLCVAPSCVFSVVKPYAYSSMLVAPMSTAPAASMRRARSASAVAGDGRVEGHGAGRGPCGRHVGERVDAAVQGHDALQALSHQAARARLARAHRPRHARSAVVLALLSAHAVGAHRGGETGVNTAAGSSAFAKSCAFTSAASEAASAK